MKTKEPPYTEPYVRWCRRTVNKIIIYLLPDSFFALVEKGDVQMKQYIGIKVVAARPMTRGDYNIFRGWQIPADEDPADEGYVMKYENGHMQWLPKDMFESDYKEYDESTLPATAIGMVSSDYKECFQAEYKQLRIRYEKLKRMRQ